MARILLNVADIRLRSRVNGPGLRSVVWVQGCTRRCRGCFNPHTHPHEKRHLFDPEQLGRELASLPDTDGITISGGEPFEQAPACATLASCVRATGQSVVVFTGYEFDYLQRCTMPVAKKLLASIDLLIAGPYVPQLASQGDLWRASTNQTIHLLTDRLRKAVGAISLRDPLVEVHADGRAMLMTGLPDERDRRWLNELAQLPREARTGLTAKGTSGFEKRQRSTRR